MSRVVKRITALTLATIVGLGLAIPQLSATSSIQANNPGGPIRDCVSKNGRLSALFLIDQSGSLQETDPLDRRVQAMKAAVAALSLNTELKTINEQDYVLEVRFDGFGFGYTSTGIWHKLTLTSNSEIEKEIEAFAIRDDESETDYKTGLEEAVQALTEHETTSGEETCKLLVWLSDGELFLGNENSDAAELDAANAMCESDSGIADQMRSQEIYTIGFGLTTTTGPQPDFSLMEGLVTGSSNCGSRDGYGQFVRVEGADDLIQALFRDLSPIPPNAKPVTACKDEPNNIECAEFRFSTRPPLDRVKMIISTTIGIDTAEVIEPSGAKTAFLANGIAIQANSATVSSNPLYQLTSIVSIDVRASTMPYGDWVVQFRGPAARDALVSASFFSDVIATIEGSDPLLIDRENPKPIIVRVAELGILGLQLPSGAAAIAEFDSDPTLEATLTIGAEIIATNVVTADADQGLFEIRASASDLSNVGPLGVLRIRPIAQINGIDIAFGDSYRNVKVLLGDGMPTISATTASDVNNEGFSKITIQLTGPEEGSGSALLSNAFEILNSPQTNSNSEYSLRIENPKVIVNAGETATLNAELDPAFSANGKLKFRLELKLEGRNQKSLSIPIDLEVKMTRPFNKGRSLKVLITMIVIFIMTQAVAIAFAATRLARVRAMPVWTRTASFPVTISSDGIIQSEGKSVAQRLGEYRSLDAALSSTHTIQISGLRYSVSRGDAIKSLFSPKPILVTAEVVDSDDARLVGDSGQLISKGRSKAVVRSELFGSWVFQWLANHDGVSDGLVTVILPRDLDDPATFAPELEGSLRGSGISSLGDDSPHSPTHTPKKSEPSHPVTDPGKFESPSTPAAESSDIDPFS